MKLTKAAIGFWFLSTAILAAAQDQQYVISTYAGGVPPPTPAPGLNMAIGSVQSVVADAAGNTYFISLNCVFKLDQNGVVTRIAGNARAGYSGDGGLAISAQLRLESAPLGWYLNPPGLTVDNTGNVYVADNGNYRIRKISRDGSITTVAGNGTPGFSGDGGPATSAQLSSVGGLAVGMAGNLWISDNGANRIREVTPDGSIATVAGTGACGFSGDGAPAVAAQLCAPSGIAADSAGNVFIADSGNGRVRKISNDGIITTWPEVAGIAEYAYGPGFACRQLCLPATVAVDHAGNVFVNTLVDEGFDIVWHLVRKISPGGVITTVAGYDCLWPCNTRADGTTATKTFLSGPLGLAVDNAGNLLIADGSGQRVRKVSSDGAIATVAGNGQKLFSGDDGPATSAQLAYPEGVAVDRGGSVFIADYVGCRIRRVTPDGIIATVAGNGTYGFSGDGGPAINAQMAPYSVTLDAAGNIFFFDIPNRSVRKVSLDGIITTVTIVGGNNYFVAVDSAGDLFIADPAATLNNISKVSPDGTIRAVAGNGTYGFSGDGGPATSAQLAFPSGVAVDSAHNVYIADTRNNRIRKVTPDGIITTIAGNGIRGFSGDGGPATSAQLPFPSGVAVDGAHNVYIADTQNNRIRKISADGIITTIAGDGTAGYSGDDGPAIKASLSMPIALAVDDAGNVYVPGANAIRVLRPVPDVRIVNLFIVLNPTSNPPSSAELRLNYLGRPSNEVTIGVR